MSVVAKLLIGVAVIVGIPVAVAAYVWWAYPGQVWIVAGLLGTMLSCLVAPALWELLDMVDAIVSVERGGL